MVHADKLSDEQLLMGGTSYIDVRNLADAHVLALEKDAAAGKRIIISAGEFTWQDWRKLSPLASRYHIAYRYLYPVDAVNSLSPSPLPSVKFITGKPGAGKKVVHSSTYNTEQMSKVLGLQLYSMKEVARDTLADYHKRQW